MQRAAAGGRQGTKRSGAAGTAGAGKARAGKTTPRKNALNYPRAGVRGPLRWFPSFRMILGALALFVLAGLGAAVYIYNSIDVPEPNEIALAETSTVYLADGETEVGTFSQVNRTILPDEDIPQNVKDAVVASEDSTFYENRGVSPRGILRAFINNIQGGARQGGSTITQQYVENYYTGTDTSYVGKVREVVMALKIDQEQSKDEILANYLNTIYFGRGAYGVQAASQAYFDKDAADLTDEEAALLVAVIPAPSTYDPANDEDQAIAHWNRVLEREVNATGTLTAEEADAMQFPETISPDATNRLGGTNGYLMQYAKNELVAQGISEEDIETKGYRITLTVDPDIQQYSVDAIENLPEDRPDGNRVGTMTLDPSTGAIRGMYGGPDYVSQSYNDASDSRMQAGSIFKTFTLVAALEEGTSLYSSWDGDSPKYFSGWRVQNFNQTSYGRVNLVQATTNSINTAYAELNIAIGPERTRDAAIQLGLAEETPGLEGYPSNVLGSASPTVQEMAEAYATIASGGVHRSPYIVQSVENPDGSTEYTHEEDAERVLDEGVAINATVALQGPPSSGSARYIGQNMGGRPVAGKTGTSEGFRSAWFVGFTPQLVTAVGMFQPSEDGGTEEPLTPFGGVQQITGGTYPTQIWTDIMQPALEGEEFIDFPPAVTLDNQRSRGEGTATTTTQAPATQAPATEEPVEDQTTEAPTTEEATTE
ncbi:MAG: transglycosylase domain-containing protein, partial [Brachybacterium sp.]|nr:transglycosylase domain-containing protein [Brachybacterium sp.]